jgi:hypothetical protein
VPFYGPEKYACMTVVAEEGHNSQSGEYLGGGKTRTALSEKSPYIDI